MSNPIDWIAAVMLLSLTIAMVVGFFGDNILAWWR